MKTNLLILALIASLTSCSGKISVDFLDPLDDSAPTSNPVADSTPEEIEEVVPEKPHYDEGYYHQDEYTHLDNSFKVIYLADVNEGNSVNVKAKESYVDEATISWGDGNVSQLKKRDESNTYMETNQYKVILSGLLSSIDKDQTYVINSVVSSVTIKAGRLNVARAPYVHSIYLENSDLVRSPSLERLFKGMSLNNIVFKNNNFSWTTNVNEMFAGLTAKRVNLSKSNFTKLKKSENMFRDANIAIIDMRGITLHEEINTDGMFQGATIEILDLRETDKATVMSILDNRRRSGLSLSTKVLCDKDIEGCSMMEL